MTTAAPRRRVGQRISAALWALLVIGAGVLSIAAYSGAEIDLELAAIILLAAVGGWMLLSAALSGLGRKREIAAATAPTVEESTVGTVEHEVERAIAEADAAATDAVEDTRQEAVGDGAAPDAPDASTPGQEGDATATDHEADAEDATTDDADDTGRSR